MRGFKHLEAFVEASYDAVAVVDGVWVWRRKRCAVERPATD
jgi:hypothetical protein